MRECIENMRDNHNGNQNIRAGNTKENDATRVYIMKDE